MVDIKEYGKALLLLAEEEDNLNHVYNDAACLASVLKENPDYLKLLNSPAVSSEEKNSLIDNALGGFNKNLKNLVKLLSAKHIANKLPLALKGFFEAYDEFVGICRAEVITARALTEEELDRLKKRLENETGKTVIITSGVDTSVLGGVRLRYLGRELDGTLKTRLENFEKRLKNAVI